MNPVPRLHAVIVNYRTAALAVDCLRSLVGEVAGCPDWRVTVVDGGSNDGSAKHLADAIAAEGWSSWCNLLPLEENRGFAAGNNAAIRPVLEQPEPPDYIWLLNPDTVVRPGAAQALLDFLAEHPKIGIVGSRLEDPDGTPQRSAFRFPGIFSEFEHAVRTGIVSKLLRHRVVAPPVSIESHSTDWVAGASMLIRREVFDAIGLMDEEYFLYYEEVDFCRRAAAMDWLTWYVPNSRVVHLVGQSSGVTNPNRTPRRMPGYWFESRQRYFRSAGGKVHAWLADTAWLIGHGLWRMRAWIQQQPHDTPEGYAWDLTRQSVKLRRA